MVCYVCEAKILQMNNVVSLRKMPIDPNVGYTHIHSLKIEDEKLHQNVFRQSIVGNFKLLWLTFHRGWLTI